MQNDLPENVHIFIMDSSGESSYLCTRAGAVDRGRPK